MKKLSETTSKFLNLLMEGMTINRAPDHDEITTELMDRLNDALDLEFDGDPLPGSIPFTSHIDNDPSLTRVRVGGRTFKLQLQEISN
jgi:hypothetical protein